MMEIGASLSDMGKEHIAGAAKVATFALDEAERFASMNFRRVRTVMERSAHSADALLAAKDVEEFLARRSEMIECSIHDVTEYGRSVFTATSKAQAAFAGLCQDMMTSYASNVGAYLEDAAKQSPFASDALANTVRSAVAAANAAWTEIASASEQIAPVGANAAPNGGARRRAHPSTKKKSRAAS